MKLLRVLPFACVASARLVACDLCSIYSANQAQGEIGKGPFAGVAMQFTHFGTLQENGREVRNDTGQYLDSSVWQPFIGYNVNERFGVQFNLPVIHRSFKRPDGFKIDPGNESGLGDVALTGHFEMYRHEKQDSTFQWNLLAGVKFPTGSTRRLREELSETEIDGAPSSGIHGHDLTLGSGSYDGIAGTSLFARRKRMYATVNVQYTIRSTGDFNYRFADDLTWAGGPGCFLLLNDRRTLALQAVVTGETKERDTFRGKRADDTGLTAIYLGPKIIFTWSDKFSAELGIDLPVNVDNTALQAIAEYRLRAGMTWHF